MAINITTVTGSAVSGLTTPAYTTTQDTAAPPNGKQWLVTSLGGTQPGVDSHLVSKPFRLSFFKPALVRALSAVGLSGVLRDVPKNKYYMIFHKGAAPLANQANEVIQFKIEFSVPAGCEAYEPEELKALCSLFCGTIGAAGFAQGLYDTLTTSAV